MIPLAEYPMRRQCAWFGMYFKMSEQQTSMPGAQADASQC